MPAWLLTIIFQLVLKLGIPALIELIKKLFPKFFNLVQKSKPILEEYLKDIEQGMDKKDAEQKAKEKFKKECHSVIGCPSDVKEI